MGEIATRHDTRPTVDIISEIEQARQYFDPPSVAYYQQLRENVIDPGGVSAEFINPAHLQRVRHAGDFPHRKNFVEQYILPGIGDSYGLTYETIIDNPFPLNTLRRTIGREPSLYGHEDYNATYYQYFKTANIDDEEHVLATFIPVHQGVMYVVDERANPLFRFTMSTCTAMAAKVPDGRLVVAHISESYLNEIDAFMKFSQSLGIRAKDVRVVASVGNVQEKKEYIEAFGDFNIRATKMEDYTSRGILPNHIQTFEYKGLDEQEIRRSLAYVMIDTYGMYTDQFDYNKKVEDEKKSSLKRSNCQGHKKIQER